MTVKLRKGSQIPAYMAYPRFLLTMDISETAKLVYVLLLDRARLSMKNEGWEDEQGHVFIYYTIADLASASGKCVPTCSAPSLCCSHKLGAVHLREPLL